jgi:prefoldin subunit 5
MQKNIKKDLFANMKNKDVEDIVKKALDEYSSKQDKWNTAIDTITSEAFAVHRVHDFQELQIKNLNKALDNKTKEIQEHQAAIDNLRGYIGFLESRIRKFQDQINYFTGDF